MSLARFDPRPSGRQLLVFALAWLVVLAALGWVSWSRHRHAAAESAWVLAAAVPAIGLLSPRFLRCVYLAANYAAYPVGFAVSRVVLALVYYLALTPIGLTMRLFGYDPLCRRLDPKAQTYWVGRGGARPAESYFRQH